MAKVKIFFQDLPERFQDEIKKEIRENIIAEWWSEQEDQGIELSDYTLTEDNDKEIDLRVDNYIFKNDEGSIYEI